MDSGFRGMRGPAATDGDGQLVLNPARLKNRGRSRRSRIGCPDIIQNVYRRINVPPLKVTDQES